MSTGGRFCGLGVVLLGAWVAAGGADAVTLEQQNEAMLQKLQQVHGLSTAQTARVREIFRRSGYVGQGNPAIARHPDTPQQCRTKLTELGVDYANPELERICGAKYMAPLYDPAKGRAQDAKACIDQFEFPDIPCEYPVVWVRAREAAELCEAEGKRLCDAHEWEGVCAAASHKTPGCQGGGWTKCGSNTYPTGDFPNCRSSLCVYDLTGNAAEHMNLPLAPSQMASRGSKTLGVTEMKGSWFIFDAYRAHPDWCRWRAPFWHGSRVMDQRSHENYHLGFRCCKTLKGRQSVGE